MTIEHKKLIYTDAKNNNNKSWEYYYDTVASTVIIKFGRIGTTLNTEPSKSITRKALDAKIREKLKKGYQEIEILTETIVTSSSKDTIKEAAKAQLIKNNSELSSLVERLVEANKHEIYEASGGQLNVDLTSGIISTPVGVVTKNAVISAREILTDSLIPFISTKQFDSDKFIENLNNYLMYIPQRVGHSRGWYKTFITSDQDVQKQLTLLDQLEASADLAEARKLTAIDTDKNSISLPDIFSTDLKICKDKKIFKKITNFFNSSINDKHDSKILKPINIYEINIPKMTNDFNEVGAKIGNTQLLWHGTRIFNVLSILKNGLMLPKAIKTMQIQGAMFGHGLYFSDQSTKSLNYAYGGVWDRGPRDNNCFMFLVDVALGKSYTPKGIYENLPKAGYDSTFAKADYSGVRNNEMIVYQTPQVNIKYLVEFDKK